MGENFIEVGFAMYDFSNLILNMPITLTRLTELSGVNEATLSRMRNGERVKRISAIRVLKALSEIYGKEYNLSNVTGINYF